MTEGAGLPVPGRRDLRVVREARAAAAAGRGRDRHPVQGQHRSRSHMRTGRQLHHPVLPSYRQVSPVLWFVPDHPECRLYFPCRFPQGIPCLLLFQNVRCCRDRLGLHCCPTDRPGEKIRTWNWSSRVAYPCQEYPDYPLLYRELSNQVRSDQTTARRNYCRYRCPVLLLHIPENYRQTIPKKR